MGRISRHDAVALLLGLGILVALGVRVWATHQALQLRGPNAVAANSHVVYVPVHGVLYELTPGGSLRRQIPLRALHVADLPASMQVLSGGDLLLGDSQRRSLLRCNMQRLICSDLTAGAARRIEGPFDFFFDESTGRLFIADILRHRILLQDPSGGDLRVVTKPGALKYPNALYVGGDGLLRIADTNHHRVAGLRVRDGEATESEWSLDARSGLGRSCNIWPVAVVEGPDGDWWVLNADGALRDADLIVYGTAGQPLRRVDLPLGVAPAAVTRAGPHMLVAAPGGLQIYQVDPRSGTVQPFGDVAFRAELQALRLQKAHYRSLSIGALVVVAVLALSLIVLAARVLGRRLRAHAGAGPRSPCRLPMSRFAGVHWLAMTEQAQAEVTRARRGLRVVVLGLVAMMAVIVGLYYGVPGVRSKFRAEDVRVIVALGVAALTLLWALLFFVGRTLRRRLGADGSFLYFADHRGMAVQVPPERVVYTGRQIAFGSLVVPLVAGPTLPCFDAQEFDRHLRPLLTRAHRIGEINMSLYQLLAREPLQMLAASLVLMLLLAAAAVGYWQGWL